MSSWTKPTSSIAPERRCGSDLRRGRERLAPPRHRHLGARRRAGRLQHCRGRDLTNPRPPAWPGDPWSTAWFHVTGDVPEDWPADEVDLDIDLGWTWGSRDGRGPDPHRRRRHRRGSVPDVPRSRGAPHDRHLHRAAANPMPTFDWFPPTPVSAPCPTPPPDGDLRAQVVRVNRVGERAANDMVLALQIARR